MKFTLNSSDRNSFICSLSKIEEGKKWFGFIYHSKQLKYYSINCLMNGLKIEIGQCALKSIDSNLDCSFFIHPEYRRLGLARSFVRYMINKNENIRFTVSQFNQPSKALFSSIQELKVIRCEMEIRTMIYGNPVDINDRLN
jgi:GNAT superfamily N-acetyltransferase